MIYDKAREILKEYITEDGSLKWRQNKCLQYLDWIINSEYITLDGEFTIEQLEALIVIIKQNFKPYEHV
jgi:hypothetical protein